MDWTDFIFPAKHVLGQAASQGQSNPAQAPSSSSQTMDIGKMAQDQADNEKAKQFKGAHQPTMQQLTGVGGSKACPTCGAPMNK